MVSRDKLDDIIEIWSQIRSLDTNAMYKLIIHYNAYVIEVCDRNDGSVPVCLPEYFTNDYVEVLNGRRRTG